MKAHTRHALPQRLVIFDIDGTLIRVRRLTDNLQRFRVSLKKVFGVDIGELSRDRWQKSGYNGMGDRYILWDLVKDLGVSRDAFLDRIGEVGDAFAEYLEGIQSGGPSYEAIPEARLLLEKVIAADHLSEGVLTGNLGASATWKLHNAGLPDFAFGVYGHEADARDDLARLLIRKAEIFFGRPVRAADVIIIGDTIHDVRCAKAIGAKVVIVRTGWNVPYDEIQNALPDLLVDSLMDERVITLLGLR